MRIIEIGLFGLALCTVTSLSHASEDALFDCSKVLDNAVSEGVIPSKVASMESLNKAVEIYSVSTEAGKCLYPNVSFTRLPIGEYEEYKNGGPELVTLTDRTVYKWDEYEVQKALILTPENLIIEVIPNGAGYRISLATKAK